MQRSKSPDKLAWLFDYQTLTAQESSLMHAMRFSCSAASHAAPLVMQHRSSVSDGYHVLAVQRRIAAGVREMLELWFQHKPFPEDFYIVREGKLAEQYT